MQTQPVQRGVLRVYLGAAPGVGKTFSMLGEGIRRQDRGAHVAVGALRRQHRRAIDERLGLISPAATHIGVGEWHVVPDVDRVLADHPEVVLVDDLAGRSDPAQPPHWQLIERLLAVGLDVITTVGMDQLDSSRDVVSRITGLVPTDTVPDIVVRSADQIELVDISPEALRRRLAHGNVFPPERVDAALANSFRPANLAALRQLALLWMADDVEQRRQTLADGHPESIVEVRERIVVAVSGTGGEELIRRASRIAGRVGGDLIAVHVVVDGAEPGPDIERQRSVVGAMGGTYREVVGDDVVDALHRFVDIEQATKVIIGRGQGGGRRLGDRLSRRSAVPQRLVERLDGVEIQVMPVEAGDSHRPPRRRARTGPSPRRFRGLAWLLCVVGLSALTLVLTRFRAHVSLGSALLIDLAVVLAVAALGGLLVGLVAAFFAAGLTNWFLTPPLHTLTVKDPENIVALAVFVSVAVVVGPLVDRAAIRSREAVRARSEAGALARSTATLVGAHDPLPELVEQLRATFGLDAAAVLERHEGGWWPTVTVGSPVLLAPSDGVCVDLAGDGSVQLVVSGGALGPDQLQVLRAFADQLTVALESRRLRADAANAEVLAETDALRSALLQSVSHDLRTPLATIKASASGLLQPGVTFSDHDRQLLIGDIDGAADRLDRLVRNLLDMSRLQAGAVQLISSPVALEDVVAAALAATPQAAGRVAVAVADDLPLVRADAALLERALANLISNAVAWSPTDLPVRVEASAVGGAVDQCVEVRIVDRGPGVPMSARDRIFQPFQRLGDRSADAGVGLGLAIAKGFVEAMGATLELEDTPGGGLTMAVRLAVDVARLDDAQATVDDL